MNQSDFVVEISENRGHAVFHCKHPDWVAHWGASIIVSDEAVLTMMANVASWANNTLKVGCYFTVD